MMGDSDMSVTIPVRLMAIAVLWNAGAGLVMWRTFWGGPQEVTAAAVSLIVAGATLTVVHYLTLYHRMIRQAFELGQETERAKVSKLR